MPFSHVAPAYEPEQLAKLTDAFDRAWPQVFLASGAPESPAELERLRQSLCNYLLASRGEFDPQKLAVQALLALIKRDRTASILDMPLNRFSARENPAAVECKPGFPQQASADCGNQ